MSKKKKICLVTTSLLIVKSFLKPHLHALAEQYDITLVVNIDDKTWVDQQNLPIKFVHVPIQRKISLLYDFYVLMFLIIFFIKERFSIVHSVAPKAGLLSMLAARIAGVSSRLHHFQGEVWLSKKGFFRCLLKFLDTVTGALASHILVVSDSERKFLISEGVISKSKSTVLGQGSICGVDLKRFKPSIEERTKLRSSMGINNEDIIILYIGRLNQDKGLYELSEAFEHLRNVKEFNIHLVIVGLDEEDIISSLKLDQRDKIHLFDFTSSPEKFMAAADILVLPSHREGFGLVIIEAAAVGIPAVASNIIGIVDAIENEVTGLLFEARNVEAMVKALSRLIYDPSLRKSLAEQARRRCTDYFSQEQSIAATLQYYKSL